MPTHYADEATLARLLRLERVAAAARLIDQPPPELRRALEVLDALPGELDAGSGTQTLNYDAVAYQRAFLRGVGRDR